MMTAMDHKRFTMCLEMCKALVVSYPGEST